MRTPCKGCELSERKPTKTDILIYKLGFQEGKAAQIVKKGPKKRDSGK